MSHKADDVFPAVVTSISWPEPVNVDLHGYDMYGGHSGLAGGVMEQGIADLVHSPDVGAGGQESLIVPDAFTGEQISAFLYSGTYVCAYGPATITEFHTSVIGSDNPYQTWTDPPYHLEAGELRLNGTNNQTGPFTVNPC